jgi:hypothetical protein
VGGALVVRKMFLEQREDFLLGVVKCPVRHCQIASVK